MNHNLSDNFSKFVERLNLNLPFPITESFFIYIFRWLVFAGSCLRFWLHRNEYSEQHLSIIVFSLIVFLIYNIFISYRFFCFPDLVTERKWNLFQIIAEVLFYSILYLLTFTVGSDVFLFFFLPLLIAAEDESESLILITFGIVTSALFSLIVGLSIHLELHVVRSIISVFLPRWTFYIAVFFLATLRSSSLRRQNIHLVKRNTELFEIYNVCQDITTNSSLDTCLETILHAGIKVLDGKGGKIYTRVPGKNKLELKALAGIETNDLKVGDTIDISEGMAGKIIKEGLSHLITDDYGDYPFSIQKYAGIFSAVIEVPLISTDPAHPKLSEDDVFGVMAILDDGETRQFNENDAIALQKIAYQAALAIRSAKFSQRERILRKSISEVKGHSDLSTLVNNILSLLKDVVPFDSGSLQKKEENNLKIIACDGFNDLNLDERRIIGITFEITDYYPNYEVVTKKQPRTIRNVFEKYPHFKSRSKEFFSGHICTWIGVPLIINNNVIGMIALERIEDIPFTNSEMRLVSAFADQAAIAFQNAEQFKKLAEQREALSLLNEIVASINQAKEKHEILKQIAEGAVFLTKLEASLIFLFNERSNRYDISMSVSYPEGLPLPKLQIDEPESLTRLILDLGQSVQITNVSAESHPIFFSAGIRSIIGSPISLGNKVCGVLFLFNWKPYNFSNTQSSILNTLVGHASIAIRQSMRVEQLETIRRKLQEAQSLATIGLLYGEDMHFSANKLGSAWQKSDNIVKRTLGNINIEDIRYIEKESRSIRTKLSAVLDHIRAITDSVVPAERTSFDIHHEIDEVISSERRSTLIIVSKDYSAQQYEIYGYKRQINQVFRVVIHNAIEAMNGEGILSIKTEDSLNAHQQFVRVIISDTGKGIHPLEQARVFDMGSSGSGDYQKSFGLGLAWARLFLNANGGNIRFETSTSGTSFYINIPSNAQEALEHLFSE